MRHYYKGYKRNLLKQINNFSCNGTELSLYVSVFELPNLNYFRIKNAEIYK